MKNWFNDRAKLNMLIDSIMLVLLMIIAGLGFLIKFVLIPGFKRNAIYEGDIELYFMGLTRHQWGSIHLYLSLFFIFLLLLHIILHWKMITCIFTKMVNGKKARLAIGTSLGFVALFFALSPFFISPEIKPMPRKHSNRQNITSDLDTLKSTGNFEKISNIDTEIETEKKHKNLNKKHQEHSDSDIEIYGYMTLDEVSDKYSIPVEELTKTLNIPSSQSGETIRRLKKQYNIEMTEIKNTIRILKGQAKN